jgi:hypothetical protein
MQKEITLEKEKIIYTLKKSRRSKYMRLTVARDGGVKVTLPWHSLESEAENFIRQKANWLKSKIAHFNNFKASAVPVSSRKDYLKYKELARGIVEKKLNHFNRLYGFSWRRISIRDQKTRWGSCSKAGNLNFSYRVIYLPEELSDYIVVHELCHLEEFNHGKAFWALVERAVPNCRQHKKTIRRM